MSDTGRAGRVMKTCLPLLAALVVAAAAQTIAAVRSPVIARDGVVFIRSAQGLLQDPLTTIRRSDQHPGYPAMIVAGWSVTRWFTDDPVAAWSSGAVLAAGVCGLLTVVVIWFLTRKLFGSGAAAVTAMLFAVLPLFRQNASDALSDTPFLLFFLLATMVALRAFERPSTRGFAGIGLLGGLAYLVRPEGLLVGIAAGVLCLTLAIRRQMDWKRAATCCGALLLVLLIVCGPYMLVKGSLTAKKDFTRLARKDKWTPARSETKDATPHPAKRAPRRSEPVRVLAAGVAEIFGEYAHGLRYGLLLPLAIGLLAGPRARMGRGARGFIPLLAAGYVLLLVVLYANSKYVSHRHVLGLAALSMPWIASGFGCLAEMLAVAVRFVGFRLSARAGGVVAAFALLAVSASLLPRSLRAQHTGDARAARVGYWLRDHHRPGESVVSTSIHVPFYAEMKGRLLRRGRPAPARFAPDERLMVLDATSSGDPADLPSDLSGEWTPIASAPDFQDMLILRRRR